MSLLHHLIRQLRCSEHMQKMEGDKRQKGWIKRGRKWRRSVNSGGIRHSVETLVVTDEINNLWAALWCFFMEADASCVISAFLLETHWLSLKIFLYSSMQFFWNNIFLIPNAFASPLTFAYPRKKHIPLSPRTHSSWDKKTRLHQCKSFASALLAVGGTGCLPCWCCYGKLEGFLQPKLVTTASLVPGDGDGIMNKMW